MKTLASLLALLACRAALAQNAAAPPDSLPFVLEPLGANVYAAIDKPEHRGLANSGFVIGDDGVAVIDTFADAGAARQLLAEIRKLTPLPVRYVINTHYHLDHVAGNRVFTDAGAVVIGHRNIRAWIHSENLKFFPDIQPERRAQIEGFEAPEIVYDSFVELYLGSRELLVRVLPGHTGSDSVIVVPDAQVVFCGDLFWRSTLPNLIDASTGPLMASDGKLIRAFPEATFVPGHGEVGEAADVQAFVGYIAALRSSVAREQHAGLAGDALVNAVLPGLQSQYGGWDLFAHFAKRNIVDTDQELRGTKHLPQPAPPPPL